jgi:NhaP-type Na+/H+ and K+/H+ antiporter
MTTCEIRTRNFSMDGPQTHAFDRAATGVGYKVHFLTQILILLLLTLFILVTTNDLEKYTVEAAILSLKMEAWCFSQPLTTT